MDILENKMVTTRKPHNCWGCTKEFPAGTEMGFMKGADAGVISRSWWCDDCIALLDTLDGWEGEDGFEYGDLMGLHLKE